MSNRVVKLVMEDGSSFDYNEKNIDYFKKIPLPKIMLSECFSINISIGKRKHCHILI